MDDDSKSADIWLRLKRRRNEFDRRRLELKVREQMIERQRATNESVETLLNVVRYLNAVQDGDALRIEGDFSRTAIDKPSRILNCHEEDIMNASLITMKRMIESLLVASTQTTPSNPQTRPSDVV